jgi:hypothetical protein
MYFLFLPALCGKEYYSYPALPKTHVTIQQCVSCARLIIRIANIGLKYMCFPGRCWQKVVATSSLLLYAIVIFLTEGFSKGLKILHPI